MSTQINRLFKLSEKSFIFLGDVPYSVVKESTYILSIDLTTISRDSGQQSDFVFHTFSRRNITTSQNTHLLQLYLDLCLEQYTLKFYHILIK